MWEALCLSNSSYLFGYFSDFSLNKLSRTALSLQSIFFYATLGWNRLRIIKNYRDIRKWQEKWKRTQAHVDCLTLFSQDITTSYRKGKEGIWLFLKEQASPPETISRKEETETTHWTGRGEIQQETTEQLTKLWLKKGYSNTDPVWIQYSKYKKHPKKLPINYFVSLWQKGSLLSSSTLHLLPTHGRSDPGLED